MVFTGALSNDDCNFHEDVVDGVGLRGMVKFTSIVPISKLLPLAHVTCFIRFFLGGDFCTRFYNCAHS